MHDNWYLQRLSEKTQQESAKAAPAAPAAPAIAEGWVGMEIGVRAPMKHETPLSAEECKHGLNVGIFSFSIK